MYVCVHACMCVCMHACMYACMHLCMYVCMYACLHVCMYACMHVFMILPTAGQTCMHPLQPYAYTPLHALYHIAYTHVAYRPLCRQVPLSLRCQQVSALALSWPKHVCSSGGVCRGMLACHVDDYDIVMLKTRACKLILVPPFYEHNYNSEDACQCPGFELHYFMLSFDMDGTPESLVPFPVCVFLNSIMIHDAHVNAVYSKRVGFWTWL